MKPVSPALLALLASGQFYVADLLTLFLIDGTVIRLTNADADIKFGGNTYLSNALLFDRDGGTWAVGVDVSQLNVTFYPFDDSLINGVPFLQALPLGLFNGAEAQVDVAYMPTFDDTSLGIVTVQYGRVGEVVAGDGTVTMPINSHLELLNRQVPANLYQTGCINSLYDAQCTLSKAAFSVTTTALAGSSLNSIRINDTHPAGYFDQGTIRFTSGANNGLMWTVKQWDGQNITVVRPLRAAPAAGDTLVVSAGCDKARGTCTNKFQNLANYRGYDFVPVPETAI